MPKVGEVYKDCLKQVSDVNLFSGDVRNLICAHLNYKSQIDVIIKSDEEFVDFAGFSEKFARFLNGEPVEYITNKTTFLNYELYVDNRVLIPRMETQELIAYISENIFDYFDPRNYLVVADIGTGSGCIALALKMLFKNWLVSASDISKDALEVAKKNFETYGLPIRTYQGNGVEPFIENKMALDIIVSNPPYIIDKSRVQDSVKGYEPESALYLDKDSSVYENIFKNYKKVKKGPLLICLEIDDNITDYLRDLMNKYLDKFEFRFVKDLNGFDRFLIIFIE